MMALPLPYRNKIYTFFFGVASTLIIILLFINYYSVTGLWENINNEYKNNSVSVILKITNCINKPLLKTIKRRGHFWVFYNFVQAERKFNCDESVTYTTPASYRFLDNLPLLVSVWKGPISVALYAPGDDFQTTLESIAFLRNCETPLIRELITFHLFFEESHFPSKQKSLINAYHDTYNCKNGAPFNTGSSQNTYKAKQNLPFPINVARNVARETAQTHFVFPSDIELYPTPNFIEKFMDMVINRKALFIKESPKVFVLPIFEILEDQTIPTTKTELQEMIKNKKAILFHESICKTCHKVIKGDEWLKATETELLDVFAVGKRENLQKVWEPFYVGTNNDPLFDERLTWEGQYNKMSQAYSLCLLNYDFMILNNAFLIHKPGIKKKKVQIEKHKELVDNAKLLLIDIRDELIKLYGNKTNCFMRYL